eukprot:g626.t1
MEKVQHNLLTMNEFFKDMKKKSSEDKEKWANQSARVLARIGRLKDQIERAYAMMKRSGKGKQAEALTIANLLSIEWRKLKTIDGHASPKISFEDILESVERGMRVDDSIAGIELGDLHHIKSFEISPADDTAPVFEELIPLSQFTHRDSKRIVRVNAVWVGRPKMTKEDMHLMLDGEIKTSYSTANSLDAKARRMFGGGNDEVLLIEFNDPIALSSIQIDFNLPPLRKTEVLEQIVLEAPEMWSVSSFDVSVEDDKLLERVDGGSSANFPASFDEQVFLLAPWEMASILGMDLECKDRFCRRPEMRGVTLEIKTFPLSKLILAAENPKRRRGYYVEWKLRGPTKMLKRARSFIISCLCHYDGSSSKTLSTSRSVGGFIKGVGIAGLGICQPVFEKLVLPSNFGSGSRTTVSDDRAKLKLLGDDEDTNEKFRSMKVSKAFSSVFGQLERHYSEQSKDLLPLGSLWWCFGQFGANSNMSRSIVTFRPTAVELCLDYDGNSELGDDGLKKLVAKRIESRRTLLKKRNDEFFDVASDDLITFDRKYFLHIPQKASLRERIGYIRGEVMLDPIRVENTVGDEKSDIMSDWKERLAVDFGWTHPSWFRVEDDTDTSSKSSVSGIERGLLRKEWMLRGDFRSSNCDIDTLRLRMLEFSGPSLSRVVLYVLWTREGIEVFSSKGSGASSNYAVLQLRAPNQHMQYMKLKQRLSNDANANAISHKRESRPRAMAIKIDAHIDPYVREVCKMIHGDVARDITRERNLREFKGYQECIETIRDELSNFGQKKDSGNEALKKAHQAIVLMPWEFHLLFGGPWLRTIQKQRRRNAEVDCEEILRRGLKLMSGRKKIPIVVELHERRDSRYRKRHRVWWELHVEAPAMFLVKFAFRILFEEFDRRTGLYHDVLTMGRNFVGRHVTSCVPHVGMHVRTNECMRDDHTERRCCISRITEDGMYIIEHRNGTSRFEGQKTSRFRIFSTPPLRAELKTEIVDILKSVQSHKDNTVYQNTLNEILKNPRFDRREEVASTIFILFDEKKDRDIAGVISPELYGLILAKLFPSLKLPVLRSSEGNSDPFSFLPDSDDPNLFRVPILYKDTIGSFCERVSLVDSIRQKGRKAAMKKRNMMWIPGSGGRSTNGHAEVRLVVERGLLFRVPANVGSTPKSASGGTRACLPENLPVSAKYLAYHQELCTSQTLEEKAERFRLGSMPNDIDQISFLEFVAYTSGMSSRVDRKSSSAIAANFERIPKQKRSNVPSDCGIYPIKSADALRKRKFETSPVFSCPDVALDTIFTKDLRKLMFAFDDLSLLGREKLVELAKAKGISVEGNDSSEFLLRELRMRTRKEILKLRSTEAIKCRSQRVPLAMAKNKSVESIAIGSLVRVRINEDNLRTVTHDSGRWLKGKLLHKYFDSTCEVLVQSTTDGSEFEVRRVVVPFTSVKSWHKVKFLKIHFKGSHYLNSSVPQLGISALKIFQRKFSPEEGPLSFSDRCWNPHRIRSLLRHVASVDPSRVRDVVYEKDKLMSGYRREENFKLNLVDYVSMGFSNWLHSVQANTMSSGRSSVMKRATLPNGLWKRVESLRRPRGIALHYEMRSVQEGLCRKDLEVYAMRLRSWRRSIVRALLPRFEEINFFQPKKSDASTEDDDLAEITEWACSKLRVGISLRYWWGLFSSCIVTLVAREGSDIWKQGSGSYTVRIERTGELRIFDFRDDNFQEYAMRKRKGWFRRKGRWDFVKEMRDRPGGQLTDDAAVRKAWRIKATRMLQNVDFEFVVRLARIGGHDVWRTLAYDDILIYFEIFEKYKNAFQRSVASARDTFDEVLAIDRSFRRYEYEQSRPGIEPKSNSAARLGEKFARVVRNGGLEDEVLIAPNLKPLHLSLDSPHMSGEERPRQRSQTSKVESGKSGGFDGSRIAELKTSLKQKWTAEQHIQRHLYQQAHSELRWATESARELKQSNLRPSPGWEMAYDAERAVVGNSPPMPLVWRFTVRAELIGREELIVSDDRAGCLRVFVRSEDQAEKFRLVRSIGASCLSEKKRLRSPQGIATDSLGRVIVADFGADRVQVIHIKTGQPQFCIDGSELDFAETRDNGERDTMSEAAHSKRPELAPWAGSFKRPSDVCVDDCNNIYIVDTGNRCVHCYTSSGEHINTWGRTGTTRFVRPVSISAYIRLPPGIRSRPVIFALESMFEKSTLTLRDVEIADVQLRQCGVVSVGDLVDISVGRICGIRLPAATLRALVDWKTSCYCEGAEQCIAVVDAGAHCVHVFTVSHGEKPNCFMKASFMKCSVPTSSLPLKVAKATSFGISNGPKTVTENKKERHPKETDVILHLLPDKKEYVYRGIALTDEKDFEQALRSIKRYESGRKMLREEQAQAADEDRRKLEDWIAAHQRSLARSKEQLVNIAQREDKIRKGKKEKQEHVLLTLLVYMINRVIRFERCMKHVPLTLRGIPYQRMNAMVEECCRQYVDKMKKRNRSDLTNIEKWLFDINDVVECWPWTHASRKYRRGIHELTLQQPSNAAKQKWVRARVTRVLKRYDEGSEIVETSDGTTNGLWRMRCCNLEAIIKKYGVVLEVEFETIQNGHTRRSFVPILDGKAKGGYSYVRLAMNMFCRRRATLCSSHLRSHNEDMYEFAVHIVRTRGPKWRLWRPNYAVQMKLTDSGTFCLPYIDANESKVVDHPRFIPDFTCVGGKFRGMWTPQNLSVGRRGHSLFDSNHNFDLEDCTLLHDVAITVANDEFKFSKFNKVTAHNIVHSDSNRRWFCGHLLYHDRAAHAGKSRQGRDSLTLTSVAPPPVKLHLSRRLGISGSPYPSVEGATANGPSSPFVPWVQSIVKIRGKARSEVPFIIGCRSTSLRKIVDCFMSFDAWKLDTQRTGLEQLIENRTTLQDRPTDELDKYRTDDSVARAKRSLAKLSRTFLSMQSYVAVNPFSNCPVVGAEYRAKMHMGASHKDDVVVRVISSNKLQRTVVVDPYMRRNDGLYVRAESIDNESVNVKSLDEKETSFSSRKTLRWVNLGPRVWLSPVGNESDRFEIFGQDPLIAVGNQEHRKAVNESTFSRFFSHKN